jgi:hypothetical protein
MHKSFLAVCFFALLGSSSGVVADTSDLPPTGGRIASPTRLVVAIQARERALIDALGKHDNKALTALVATDFAQYSLSRGMSITPRTEWLQKLTVESLQSAELNNLSAIDHGNTLVANFELRLAGAKTGARRFAVVDVWSKGAAATDWILTQRYIASLNADAGVPGENLQNGIDPNKRI